ncbi:hypothetical protein [Ramlibacter tataouinensis]|uniref:Lectin n=1 Tax=Ramlibacter tataouinensis (strain ATCC BAA-407 / DSM 14655 / LMG 21543 / TTB310) TaxID=365046 RepID=F5XWN8_RAMTT|nr:hypothetical protein [Ramlibacter tataouinensis]AEG94182.1 conserved hypothetical protein [Ramlibacter tataouinensis TTB310]
MRASLLLLAVSVSVLAACAGTASSRNPMGFFVTSANPGQGANFGGLAGADAHCQKLASAAGAGSKNWRAYLSTSGAGSVNARDRIGRGPWTNAKGVVVATGVDDLHGPNNRLNKQTALTEKGEMISGRGDAVNLHDILTGSTPEGRASSAAGDTTCSNWTSGGAGSALVGHHDRMGLSEEPPAKSWNSSHGSRGCGLDALRTTGGGGLLYCFAAN